MPINQSFLGEFGHELEVTRKILSRIPDDKLGWKPHETSMALGALASHIAEMYHWGEVTIQADEFDMAPPGAPKREPFVGQSTAEILAKLDAHAAGFQAALASATDDAAWMKQWTLKMGGQPVFSLARVGCVRGMIMNHIVHHRGQLSVYLRMLGVPVPALYGPSADEQTF